MARLPKMTLFAWFLMALLMAACDSDSEPNQPAEPTDFVSVVPGSTDGDDLDGDGTADEAGDGDGDGDSGPGGASGDGDVARAIEEADILKVDGDRLYALSRYSGLSIIDIAKPSDLKLLGAHRTTAMPFEMYVDGDRAYVMYRGWGRYQRTDDGYWSWETSSRIQALDLSNAGSVEILGEFDIPGELSDSRKVGDVLYLVTYENGYCWECENTANTRVTSFDVSDPDEFELIDELRFVEDDDSWWGRRSISVTPERIYVSGWSWSEDDSGVINVVDISDPAGALVEGAELAIAGPIESRWQMDEYEGVLRVISQPGGWNSSEPPVVETFQVSSSEEITPLGSLEMVLPRPEDLRSVRFDQEHAYAITFERTDPLFTLDLSDPENPEQLGELEIPGWVYHMEPRGDRIYALGFEDGNDGGSLHVSLFDVSDLSDPVQLARVNFGGDWARLAEDQDRIHKAFAILESEGLILVPYAGWDYLEEEGQEEACYYRSEYHSGIQLVDMTRDTLELRGVAPQVGQARRGFLVEGTLFGLSDNAVQTFDITDRDEPTGLGRLELARNVRNVQAVTDAEGETTVMRFGHDWWTDQTILDFSSLDQVDRAEPLGGLDLSELDLQESSCNSWGNWEGQVLVSGDYAYVPYRTTSWDKDEERYLEALTFYVVDISDRGEPRIVGDFSVESEEPDEDLTGILLTESALLVGRRYRSWENDEQEIRASYDVFSLEDRKEPQFVTNLEVPDDVANAGWGRNFSGCTIDVGWGWWSYGYNQALVSGDVIASQHRIPLDDDTGRMRYYLDRIDVSDPEKPRLLEPVNIPGSVVDFDEKTGRLVTLDYSYEEHEAQSWDDCDWGYFSQSDSLCRVYRQHINTLVLDGDVARRLDRVLIDEGESFASAVAVSENRVFAHYYDYDEVQRSELRSFSIDGDGELSELPQVQLSNGTWADLFARDGRAFISSYGSFEVVDTTDPEDVTKKNFELGGYSCNSLEVTETHAYCALGAQGVQAFELD